MLLFEEIQICNDEDVRGMFENYLNFINLGPLELYARFRRTVDKIVSLCKKPNQNSYYSYPNISIYK